MDNIKQTVVDTLGFSGKKIRYGVVAVGDISQIAWMPGVYHTGNSEITALCTSDPKKAEEVGKQYNIPSDNLYNYEQFNSLLQSGKVDALYIATPNWRHLEFTIPALQAGIHVLLEKPIEIDTPTSQKIVDAAKSSKAKLMLAYRLHFEPTTIACIEKVRSGDLGEVYMFTSTFTQPLHPENHRAKHGRETGPVLDMGVYPINAARNLFGTEPIEVYAKGTKHKESGFTGDFEDTVSVIMTFPDNKMAQFVVSYFGNSTDEYTIVGTKGSIRVTPGFLFTEQMAFDPISILQDKKTVKFKQVDHFGGQTKYFSDCILNNKEVEPDGEEGICDVRICDAISRSLDTNAPVKLEPYKRAHRIEKTQEQTLNPVTPKKEVNARQPEKEPHEQDKLSPQ